MGTMNESEARRAALTAAVEVNKTWRMENPSAVLAVATQFEAWLTRDSQDEHGHPLKVIASRTPEHGVPAFPLTAWARKQRQESAPVLGGDACPVCSHTIGEHTGHGCGAWVTEEGQATPCPCSARNFPASTAPTASVRGAGTPQTGACEACPHRRSAHSDRGCSAAGWDGDDMCPCTLPPKFTARTKGSRTGRCEACSHPRSEHGFSGCWETVSADSGGEKPCQCTLPSTNARTSGVWCSVCEHGPHGAGNCGGGEAGDRACDCNGLTVTATNYLAQASTPPSTLPDTASTVQFVHDEDGPVLAGELYPDAYCAGWASMQSVTNGCEHLRTEHDAHGCTVGRGKEGSCLCTRRNGS